VNTTELTLVGKAAVLTEILKFARISNVFL